MLKTRKWKAVKVVGVSMLLIEGFIGATYAVIGGKTD
jgi:hypothetical protein